VNPSHCRRSFFSFVRSLATLRVRLTLWYVALLFVILVAFSSFLIFSLSNGLYGALDSKLDTDARLAQEGLQSQNGQLRLGPGIDQLSPGSIPVLVDPSGQTLLDGDPRWPIDAPINPSDANAGGMTNIETVYLNRRDAWRVLVAPVQRDGQTVALLEVGRPDTEVKEALQRLGFLLLLAVPTTIVLAASGGLFLANRALAPVDKMTRTARRIGAQDLSQRIGLPTSHDEVGRLAETFDDMLERLDQAFQRQRQFSADASHELRTPLAIITSQIDVALEQPRSAKQYAAVLQGLRSESERMSELLGQLLSLSRADAGREHLTKEAVSLDELAAEVAAQLAPVAQANGVELKVDASDPIVIPGDQTYLIRLVMNLLDNALKFTPAGGRVIVAVKSESPWAVVSVSDTGVGIPAEHLPHVFERFYRVDKARSRAAGGAGLGLAICDWIAGAHGGRIEVISAPGRGSTFSVFLPAGSS
jgi:heavy metal sensor kinase